MTLKELSAEFFKLKQARRPGVPLHALPRYSFTDKSANELTKAILAWFELKGIEAWRQNSTGRYVQEKRQTNVLGHSVVTQKGRYIPSAGGKGSGDIQAILPPHGRVLNIEVKIGRDRLRDSQIKFKDRIEKMGGLYLVIRSWDEFITASSSLLQPHGTLRNA